MQQISLLVNAVVGVAKSENYPKIVTSFKKYPSSTVEIFLSN